MNSFDAILFLSFGGPEGPDDVMPFLENVLRGRGVPEARKLEVAQHYLNFGGKSPINDANRDILARLRVELDRRGIALPIYFGNRNWHPMLTDTMRTMTQDGVKRALAFTTSAYSSYSSCRQYREDIARAQAEIGAAAPTVEKLRAFFNHPRYLEAVVAHARDAMQTVPSGSRLVFTAHSIPTSMADTCDYVAQLKETSRLVSTELGVREFDLVYQSRSGPPAVPWLEPDILDHVRALHARGESGVLIVPIGFVSDHMEVVYDLDHAAKDVAATLSLPFARAKTAGTHPSFVAMICELIEERLSGKERRSLGVLGPRNDVCESTCCPTPARPSR